MARCSLVPVAIVLVVAGCGGGAGGHPSPAVGSIAGHSHWVRVVAMNVARRPLTPNCTTRGLTVRVVQGGEAGLGHDGYVIRFTNRGNRCALRGYPGVDGLAHGRVVVKARRTRSGYLGGLRGRRIRTVVLRRGKTGSALLEGLGASLPGRRCRHFTTLRITPPNATRSVRRHVRAGICYPQIHPVVAGRDGGG